MSQGINICDDDTVQCPGVENWTRSAVVRRSRACEMRGGIAAGDKLDAISES